MQITVTGRHLDLTPTIEEYAQKKASKLTRYFDRVQQIEVRIDKQKNDFEVELIVDVEHHDPFVATARDGDLYASIDIGVDKAARQLTDHKNRLRDNKHPHSSGI